MDEINIASTLGRYEIGYNQLLSLCLSIMSVSQVLPPAHFFMSQRDKAKETLKIKVSWQCEYIFIICWECVWSVGGGFYCYMQKYKTDVNGK